MKAWKGPTKNIIFFTIYVRLKLFTNKARMYSRSGAHDKSLNLSLKPTWFDSFYSILKSNQIWAKKKSKIKSDFSRARLDLTFLKCVIITLPGTERYKNLKSTVVILSLLLTNKKR